MTTQRDCLYLYNNCYQGKETTTVDYCPLALTKNCPSKYSCSACSITTRKKKKKSEPHLFQANFFLFSLPESGRKCSQWRQLLQAASLLQEDEAAKAALLSLHFSKREDCQSQRILLKKLNILKIIGYTQTAF